MTIAATTRTPSGSNSRISAATLITWSPGSRGWLVDSSSSGSRKPTAGRKASTRISRTGSRAREELRGVLEARKIGVAVGLAATDAAALSRLGLTVVSKRMGVEPSEIYAFSAAADDRDPDDEADA